MNGDTPAGPLTWQKNLFLFNRMIFFFDLDGVIIDSAKECYLISKLVYYNDKEFTHEENLYSKLFYKHRGLVGNAGGFQILHTLIEKKIKNKKVQIEKEYDVMRKNTNSSKFEKLFFQKRSFIIDQDFSKWIKLNPLTKFGKKLREKKDININIITTKNRTSTKLILNFHKIHYNEIYPIEEISKYGSKGNLIINKVSPIDLSKVVFLDDLVDHLEIARNLGIKSYFANWGYGQNTNFELFNFQILDN